MGEVVLESNYLSSYKVSTSNHSLQESIETESESQSPSRDASRCETCRGPASDRCFECSEGFNKVRKMSFLNEPHMVRSNEKRGDHKAIRV